MADESGPFALMLPRRPGHKESRYAHLFCQVDASADTYESSTTAPPARQSDTDNRRIDTLEKKVDELQAAFSDLRDQFLAFKREAE